MKVWIDVLGCPKNEADSSVVTELLIQKGYEIANDLEKADVAIINTCGFITAAKEESINEIFRVVQLKQKKAIKLIVHGCLVQRYLTELRNEIPEVDSFLGVVVPQKVVEAVEKPYDFVGLPQPIYDFSGRKMNDKPYAYVKIGDGCNRQCSFCAIPLIKGPLKNRTIEDVIKEVEFLVMNGKREIVLVSQDLTQYRDKSKTLLDLLYAIDRIKGNFWVRLLYLYPDGVTNELIGFVKNSHHFLHYFDIPIQHASPKILEKMHRSSNVKDLERKFLKIREAIKDAIIRTTVMVGFPGETKEDIEKLVEFMQKIKFDKLGAFVYSDEEGTPAHSLGQKIPETVAKKRYDRVMQVQKKISFEKNKKHVGKILDVMVESKESGVYIGRSYMDAPEIDGYVHFTSSKILKSGDVLKVKIKNWESYDLEGVGL